MRPGGCITASAHLYELLSPALFSFSPLSCEYGTIKGRVMLLGSHESQDAPSTLGPDLSHSGGAPARFVEKEQQAGLAEPSGHQLGSETAILSLASCFLVEIPFKGGRRPQKGAKVLRNRETITFTR